MFIMSKIYPIEIGVRIFYIEPNNIQKEDMQYHVLFLQKKFRQTMLVKGRVKNNMRCLPIVDFIHFFLIEWVNKLNKNREKKHSFSQLEIIRTTSIALVPLHYSSLYSSLSDVLRHRVMLCQTTEQNIKKCIPYFFSLFFHENSFSLYNFFSQFHFIEKDTTKKIHVFLFVISFN